MAFDGYLIAFIDDDNTLVKFPLKYMRYESYNVSNHRLDLDSTRDTTGVLHRTVLTHSSTKLYFNMPSMTGADLQTAMTFFRNAMEYSTGNTLARKLLVNYYDVETDTYRNGIFYMPDPAFVIRNIDEVNKIVNYGETKITFIEY